MLTSIINSDIKGVMYGIGLVLACVVAAWSATSSHDDSPDAPLRNEACSAFALGPDGSAISTVPLGIVVYSYTFFYLLIFIANLGNITDDKGILGSVDKTTLNAMMAQNIPILLLFPILIICEALWLKLYNCILSPNQNTMISLGIFIGGATGVLWAILITSTRKIELQYVNKYGASVCNRPRKSMMRCKMKNADAATTDTSSTTASTVDANAAASSALSAAAAASGIDTTAATASLKSFLS